MNEEHTHQTKYIMQQFRKPPQHNQFQFQLRSESFGSTMQVIFDSDFDSGNCARIDQNGVLQYTIHTANDCAGTSHSSYPKSWFYFSVVGFPKCIVKFIVKNLNMLWPVSKSPELYRPVSRIEGQEWTRLERPVQIYTRDNELEVHFEQQFNGEGQKIYFALSYPYSYQELQQRLDKMESKLRHDKSIYFNREPLIKTADDRSIDLVVISSHEGKQPQRAPYFNSQMFPEREQYSRPYKFRNGKPIILISARVHPGETPASHTMNGILDFLTSTQDARAYLLRKYFVFYCIPMLNPDGVYQGHYRMDQFNQNLNRYYQNPDPAAQPACYAVRKLADHLNEENHLIMYCDLHAHGGKKGCFFYGNAFEEFVYQVESQLLARVFGANCINFEYDYCNFSRKHMTVKDRNEDRTKEGCGRVCFYKQYGLIHSYTLEMGFHSSNYITPLSFANNVHRKLDGYGFTEEEAEVSSSELYKKGPPFYTIEIYENIGRCFLISILDIFDKNPYSRIQTSQFKSLDNLRKEIAVQVSKLDRFRKEDGKLQTKLKKINELIYDSFYSEFQKWKTFDEQINNAGRSLQMQPRVNPRSETKEPLPKRREQTQRRFKINQVVLKKPIAELETDQDGPQGQTLLVQQKHFCQLPTPAQIKALRPSPEQEQQLRRTRGPIQRLNQKFHVTKKDIRFPEIGADLIGTKTTKFIVIPQFNEQSTGLLNKLEQKR